LGVGSEATVKLWPHLLQKLLSGGCVEPQFGHDMPDSVDEPHFLQTWSLLGFRFGTLGTSLLMPSRSKERSSWQIKGRVSRFQ